MNCSIIGKISKETFINKGFEIIVSMDCIKNLKDLFQDKQIIGKQYNFIISIQYPKQQILVSCAF